jgi:hypothetical protein
MAELYLYQYHTTPQQLVGYKDRWDVVPSHLMASELDALQHRSEQAETTLLSNKDSSNLLHYWHKFFDNKRWDVLDKFFDRQKSTYYASHTATARQEYITSIMKAGNFTESDFEDIKDSTTLLIKYTEITGKKLPKDIENDLMDNPKAGFEYYKVSRPSSKWDEFEKHLIGRSKHDHVSENTLRDYYWYLMEHHLLTDPHDLLNVSNPSELLYYYATSTNKKLPGDIERQNLLSYDTNQKYQDKFGEVVEVDNNAEFIKSFKQQINEKLSSIDPDVFKIRNNTLTTQSEIIFTNYDDITAKFIFSKDRSTGNPKILMNFNAPNFSHQFNDIITYNEQDKIDHMNSLLNSFIKHISK